MAVDPRELPDRPEAWRHVVGRVLAPRVRLAEWIDDQQGWFNFLDDLDDVGDVGDVLQLELLLERPVARNHVDRDIEPPGEARAQSFPDRPHTLLERQIHDRSLGDGVAEPRLAQGDRAREVDRQQSLPGLFPGREQHGAPGDKQVFDQPFRPRKIHRPDFDGCELLVCHQATFPFRIVIPWNGMEAIGVGAGAYRDTDFAMRRTSWSGKGG